MPELPEVETVRLQLMFAIAGKTISTVKSLHPKYATTVKTLNKKIKGLTIARVDRIGKLMIFAFKENNDVYLLGHLKMTGQFLVETKDKDLTGGGHTLSEDDYKKLPGRHSRVQFDFTDGTRMFFNDMRMFGYLHLVNKEGMLAAKSRFGPEPLLTNFPISTFTQKVQRSIRPIKAILLDQTVIAGLGNIYVDEVLFQTKIVPTRMGVEITDKEAKELVKASKQILEKAIKAGETTFQHFADTEDKKGNFTNQLKVFGRQNTPCLYCKNDIKKTRVTGRGTHFCERCQK